RAELGLTLEALASKLAPRRLVEEGIAMITQSPREDKDVVMGLGEALRANPVPLALIGLGVAWLLAENTGLAHRVAHDERIQAARDRILGRPGDDAIDAGGTDGSGGWVHQAAGTARSAIRSISDIGGAA